MSDYTQGPWKAEMIPPGSFVPAKWVVNFGDDGEEICDNISNEGDARLIAAAPDLLVAVKRCALILAGEDMSKNALIRVLESAKTAMIKAGESI